MPLSLVEFTARLTSVGLLTSEQIDAAIRSTALPPEDGERLARLLVREKLLTAFQAKQVLSGRETTLTLGSYRLLDKLGEGGMGAVYKAEHLYMKRVVALKVLRPDIVNTEDAIKRFLREVQAAGRLVHDNIVAAYDADEVRKTHYLVMEYVAGTDLSAYVKKQGPVALEIALDWIRQAARGLEFAHAQGVIHRDIKPANLLLNDKGVVKILDMGLARIDGDAQHQANLTSTGAVMGTIDYMSPEQAVNTKAADARADVYSLGCTLFFLLTGKPMYKRDTLVQRLLAHRDAPLPPLADELLARDIDAAKVRTACAVFSRMVAKKAADRYESMTQLLTELDECLSSGAPVAPQPSVASDESQFSEFLAQANQQTRRDRKTGESSIAAGKTSSKSRGSKTNLQVSKAEVLPIYDAERSPSNTRGHNRSMGVNRKPWFMSPLVWSGTGGGVVGCLVLVFILTRPSTEFSTESTPLTSSATAAESEATTPEEPAPAPQKSTPEPVPENPVELLAAIQNTPEGYYQIDMGKSRGGGVDVTWDVPDEYELELEIERFNNQPEGRTDIFLPYLGRMTDVRLDCVHGDGSISSAIDEVDGVNALSPQNATFTVGQFLPPGKSHRVVLRSTREGLRVTANGRTVIDFTATPDHVSLPGWARSTSQDPHIRLFGWNGRVIFRKVTLKPLSLGPKLDLPGQLEDEPTALPGNPRRAQPIREPINVLTRIAFPRNRVFGEWTFEGEALVSKVGTPFQAVLRRVLPEEYDVEVVVERLSGEDGVTFQVLYGGQPVTISVDCFQPPSTGLGLVDGKNANENETTRRGSLLKNGQQDTILLTVRKDSLKVEVNNKTVIDWNGDASRLSLPNNGRGGQALRRVLKFGAETSPVRFHKVELRAAPAQQT